MAHHGCSHYVCVVALTNSYAIYESLHQTTPYLLVVRPRLSFSQKGSDVEQDTPTSRLTPANGARGQDLTSHAAMPLNIDQNNADSPQISASLDLRR